MVPTAVSQIIEQIINAVVSIVGASVLFGMGSRAGEKAGEELLGPAYGAAGGTLGTVIGAAAGLLFLLFVLSDSKGSYKRKRKLFSYFEDSRYDGNSRYFQHGDLQHQPDIGSYRF